MIRPEQVEWSAEPFLHRTDCEAAVDAISRALNVVRAEALYVGHDHFHSEPAYNTDRPVHVGAGTLRLDNYEG